MSAQLEQSLNITQLLWQSYARFIDLQLEGTRALMETNARKAAMVGIPDLSNAFKLGDSRDGNGGMHIFQWSTNQMLDSGRRVANAYSALQGHWAHFVQQEAEQLTKTVCESLARTASCMQQGMQTAADVTKQTLDQAEGQIDSAQQAVKEQGNETAKRFSQGLRAREPAQEARRE